MNLNNASIGVFDSGIGGLTVLQSLSRVLVLESYVYIGDTARLPYGTKSKDTIIRYTESIVRILLQQKLKALVIACNTASTHALDAVKMMAPHIPVVGMIAPAAAAAVHRTKNRHIAVIGTTGTINSKAYDKAIAALAPDILVSARACQMLVALAEEGWHEGPIAEAILREYLDPLLKQEQAPDTLILGCTHFPVFEKSIRKLYGEALMLVNSGAEAAKVLQTQIEPSQVPGSMHFYVTDGPERFAASATLFFGKTIQPDQVQLFDIVDLSSRTV